MRRVRVHRSLATATIGVVVAALVATVGTSVPAHASSSVVVAPNNGHITSWGRRTVAIDTLGFGKSDAVLGFKTHWECVTALDNPNDPFTCVRVADAVLGSSSDTAHLVPYDVTQSSCSQNAGIKIWEDSGPSGNCARFTGTGNLYLVNVFFPNGDSVGNNASALSTVGSSGHGTLLCSGGAQFPFSSNTSYSYIGNACNDKVQWLESL